MLYKQSSFRRDFNRRVESLRRQCVAANRKSVDPEIRDLVFQCTILHTSAATESYLKLIISSFFFNLRGLGGPSQLPLRTRLFVLSKHVDKHFNNFAYHKEEGRFIETLVELASVFELAHSECSNWDDFDASLLTEETTYPSIKNIKRLLIRIGVIDPMKKVNKILRGDFESLITNFQGLRTALAHEAPPQITLLDAKARIADMVRVVRVLDRILHEHFIHLAGQGSWEMLC